MKRICVCLCVMATAFGMWAQRAGGLAGNLTEYPYVEVAPPAQTPAPAGYEPFHMEHYGRHGSRWLIGENDYLTPVRNLEKAEKAGKLTPLGEKTLTTLREIAEASKGRLGELSDKGALQHQAIGRRMAQNYPKIFNPTADIDAKSTVVIRCILSMLNGLEGIQQIVPSITPTKDASYADMWFMNYDDKPAWPIKDAAEQSVVNPYKYKHQGNGSYLDRLVTDPQFARDSVAPGIMPYLYWVLGAAQGHSDQPWLLEEVFSQDELLENWKGGNAFWFIHSGDTPMTNHRMPYTQRKLLGRIIEQTDSAIASKRPSARLRYGHDGILVNLVTLMEIEDYGKEVTDLDQLEELNWRDYDIIPMAGNLQLVFYRRSGSTDPDDVLVKALLNEREVRLPGTPVTGPYYSWKELRKYYQDKLDDFEKRFAE
ncbi:MAG: histidine-type phosphatase [Muribaculaceae bacterium]|nr:histidine-type phosphatase [Muribaculaceae bacterium]MDE6793991.1 histidine-type phosphatase [Muribaculaceae bacterium]